MSYINWCCEYFLFSNAQQLNSENFEVYVFVHTDECVDKIREDFNPSCN